MTDLLVEGVTYTQQNNSSEKLNFIKEVEWLNLSVERLTDDYKYKITTKKAQIIDNQAAASNIVAAAMQQ